MRVRGGLALLAAVLFATWAAWVMPVSASLIGNGQPQLIGVHQAWKGTAKLMLDGRWGDPASAYPRRARRRMPDAVAWWCGAGGALGCSAALLVVLGRRVDVRVATPRLARRWFEITGARPRAWARPRDLRLLLVHARAPGRLTLGTIGRLRRLVAAEPEWHVAVVAPSGSGKTSRFVIPWVLEADGPVVVCSTKLDVVEATSAYRSRLGRVWVWDPFGPRSSGWSPLSGCREWGGALRRAKWLTTATGSVSSDAARFWQEEAAKLLAPLLHAGALAGGGMATVLRWLDEQAVDEPLSALEAGGAGAAAEQLRAVVGLDDRNRGTTYMSAANLVAAYRHPGVQARDRPEIRPEAVLDGAPNTMYLVAGEDDQELLAPLVVSILAELLTHAQRVARLGRPVMPALRVLVDETANIAPLEQLPKYLAGTRAANVRIVTVWQDLSQLRARYGEADGTVLSNSQVKVFLGPVTDDRTRAYLVGLLGDEDAGRAVAGDERGGRRSARRPRATAQALQQLAGDRALVVHGALSAALVDVRPWWRRRELRRLADGGG